MFRADANNDGRIDIADPIFTLSFLFARGTPPVCPDACDTNDDGAIDLADAVASLSYLFEPGAPGSKSGGIGTCALDTTPDMLGSCRESACRN
jgi:hypothetical protein